MSWRRWWWRWRQRENQFPLCICGGGSSSCTSSSNQLVSNPGTRPDKWLRLPPTHRYSSLLKLDRKLWCIGTDHKQILDEHAGSSIGGDDKLLVHVKTRLSARWLTGKLHYMPSPVLSGFGSSSWINIITDRSGILSRLWGPCGWNSIKGNVEVKPLRNIQFPVDGVPPRRALLRAGSNHSWFLFPTA